jgi:hypothetical protein
MWPAAQLSYVDVDGFLNRASQGEGAGPVM